MIKINQKTIECLTNQIQISIKQKDWQKLVEIDKLINIYLKQNITNKDILYLLIEEYKEARKICIKETSLLKKKIVDLNNNYLTQKHYNLQENIQ